MKKLNLHYIAGLIDADGSFSISLSDRRYKGNALTVSPVINFRQMSQYREVVESVKKTIGFGSIYKHSDNMLTWQTTSHIEAILVAKKILPYLHIKKNTCKEFLKILEEWNGKSFNKHSSRSKHQLTRPIWLIEKMLDTALNLNKCRQTETAYKNKEQRIIMLKKRINDFYS